METFTYPHFDHHQSVVHVALFLDVSNAKDLRTRIVNASTLTEDAGDVERETVNFAFIDARLITSRLHLQTAIYQALLSQSQGILRTKTVHSEIIWALNPSNNITEALRRHGVSDGSTSLFVVRVASPELQDVQSKMLAVVDGAISPLSKLASLTDWSSIRKYYKLNSESAVKEIRSDANQEHAVVDKIVVSSVAMKSVMQ
ncbi:CGI-121-domain-containing protein [Stereum hirsutum FP-91666 SS1]|uniref:CGI-121-domain-containing protein n=1 Tax=Stereum hirsutum (strain FP-91666) TaxID=721885 RepID=UPI000444A5A8|nr:CGI-121-domain-containing protein [Stereum hirsutum FP-91666 SS1]EIM85448.1 CGI-121-domain-containing protein [Stereum hirsutum FP-91666 SS1]